MMPHQTLLRVIQSTSNSLYPADAEAMILQLGSKAPSRSSSNGSYGIVPVRELSPAFFLLYMLDRTWTYPCG
jgi:hypothetical protein